VTQVQVHHHCNKQDELMNSILTATDHHLVASEVLDFFRWGKTVREGGRGGGDEWRGRPGRQNRRENEYFRNILFSAFIHSLAQHSLHAL
jgi:hypothetical protein